MCIERTEFMDAIECYSCTGVVSDLTYAYKCYHKEKNMFSDEDRHAALMLLKREYERLG